MQMNDEGIHGLSVSDDEGKLLFRADSKEEMSDLLVALISQITDYYCFTAVPRSSKWDKVESEYKKAHPTCAACGTRLNIQVHHVKPFHLFPELELDPENLISLCVVDHLTFGHLKNWSAYNPDVRKDAANYLEKVKHREVA